MTDSLPPDTAERLAEALFTSADDDRAWGEVNEHARRHFLHYAMGQLDVVAQLVADARAEGAAKALEEAASCWRSDPATGPSDVHPHEIDVWLTSRADAIRQGGEPLCSCAHTETDHLHLFTSNRCTRCTCDGYEPAIRQGGRP